MPVVSELLTCFTKMQTKMADGVANDTNQPPKDTKYQIVRILGVMIVYS